MTDAPRRLPPGRPLTLTDDLGDQIAAHVSAGNYLGTAASLAGVSRAALNAWLRRGRIEADRLAAAHEAAEAGHPLDDPDPQRTAREAPFVALLDKVDQAQATAEDVAVAAWVGKVKDGDWRAAATYLARTRPDTWGPRTHVRVTDDESQARIDAAVDAALADPSLGLTDDLDTDTDPGTT